MRKNGALHILLSLGSAILAMAIAFSLTVLVLRKIVNLYSPRLLMLCAVPLTFILYGLLMILWTRLFKVTTSPKPDPLYPEKPPSDY